MFNNTGINSIQLKDLNEIKQISDACFGENYLTISQLNQYMGSKGVFIYYRSSNQIIGYCIGLIMNTKSDMELEWSNLDNELTFTFPLGIIKNIAVKPSAQNQGIGTLLLDACIHKLKNQFLCKTMYYPAWTESTSFLFTKKVKIQGFSNKAVFQNYWTAASIQKNYQCSKCGNPPCSCSMTLFVKNL